MGIALYDPRQHHTALYGEDPGVVCLSFAGLGPKPAGLSRPGPALHPRCSDLGPSAVVSLPSRLSTSSLVLSSITCGTRGLRPASASRQWWPWHVRGLAVLDGSRNVFPRLDSATGGTGARGHCPQIHQGPAPVANHLSRASSAMLHASREVRSLLSDGIDNDHRHSLLQVARALDSKGVTVARPVLERQDALL